MLYYEVFLKARQRRLKKTMPRQEICARVRLRNTVGESVLKDSTKNLPRLYRVNVVKNVNPCFPLFAS